MKTLATYAIVGMACAFLIVPHGFSPPVNANVIQTALITCSKFYATAPYRSQGGDIKGFGFADCSYNLGLPIDWKVEVVVLQGAKTSKYVATAQYDYAPSTKLGFTDDESCASGTWTTAIKVFIKVTKGGKWNQQAQGWSSDASINCTPDSEE